MPGDMVDVPQEHGLETACKPGRAGGENSWTASIRRHWLGDQAKAHACVGTGSLSNPHHTLMK